VNPTLKLGIEIKNQPKTINMIMFFERMFLEP
jgi:hypothetical protein